MRRYVVAIPAQFVIEIDADSEEQLRAMTDEFIKENLDIINRREIDVPIYGSDLQGVLYLADGRVVQRLLSVEILDEMGGQDA